MCKGMPPDLRQFVALTFGFTESLPNFRASRARGIQIFSEVSDGAFAYQEGRVKGCDVSFAPDTEYFGGSCFFFFVLAPFFPR